MKQLLKRLDDIGFEKSRRAVAGLSLSLFTFFYLLMSLNAPPGWGPAFLAMTACYLVAFLGVVAEWFWGRWFASGLGWWGVMVSIFALVMAGWSPPFAIYGGLHLAVVLALAGKKMVARYDLQEAWRQRYGMDEFGVARLRKTVTRASASLPGLILYALGPKPPEGMGEGMLTTAVGIAAVLLAAAGLRGVIRMRSWGLLAMGAALIAVVASAGGGVYGTDDLINSYGGFAAVANTPNSVGVGPLLPAIFLGLALLPFVGPAVRFLTRRA